MKLWFAAGLATLALPLAASAPTAKAAPSAAISQEFDLHSEPGPPDWRYFIQAPETEREKLWLYQVERGKHLKHWSWGWRLGWVRVCSRSQRAYCGGVLREALFDKALVVRAEAATRMGRQFEGSERQDMIDLLARAYQDVRNRRRGKPMFVQTRLLYAIHQIGGSHARSTGAKLAGEHELVRSYWQKLERGHEG